MLKNFTPPKNNLRDKFSKTMYQKYCYLNRDREVIYDSDGLITAFQDFDKTWKTILENKKIKMPSIKKLKLLPAKVVK